MFGGIRKGGLAIMNRSDIEEQISTEEKLEQMLGKEDGGDVAAVAEEGHDLLHNDESRWRPQWWKVASQYLTEKIR